jgi:lipoprotein-anchoring transpeptidase ErfK/SrfK
VPRGRRQTHFLSEQTRAAAFRWLLAGLILLSVAWVGWRSQQEPPPPAAAQPVTLASTNTRAPALVPVPVKSNLPPPPVLFVRTNLPPLVLTNRPSSALLVTSPPPLMVVTSPPPPVVVTSPPPVLPHPTNPTNPPPLATSYPRPVQDVLEAQVALVRQRISPGCIDGTMGFQTREALQVFQRERRLPRTGELDPATRAALVLDAPALGRYTITTNDTAQLQPLSSTWAGKAAQSALAYETLLELVAERSCASQKCLQRLNPSVDWSRVRVGQSLVVPKAAYPEPKPERKAAFVRIRLAARTLQAFDAQTNLLAHFPCSIAQRVEKRPVGQLRIVVVAPDPNYTFKPAMFGDSAEARAMDPDLRLLLKPGPNNPVGVAWIGLDRAGYGIHGTPVPEQVGLTESHGCFRLANWNAAYLLKLVAPGTLVRVEP